MVIEFDPDKDRRNQAKHGVSLAVAERLDWAAGRYQQARTVAGEARWQMLTRGDDGQVYSVIFTRRGGTVRIISLRRASRKERRAYGE